MNDNFSFDGADAADMPLDLSFSSLPLPEGEAAAGFHLPEMEPGTGQEQAAADINLLNGSDVMETTPSPFPAPEDPSETEFRPQLTDPESLHDQRRQSKPRFPLPPGDGDSPCNTVIRGSSRETTVIHREPRNSTAYTETKSKTETYTDKQENNAEGNNTVVCSDPPAAPVLPARSLPVRERLNDVRGMRCADNHADMGASPGAARFMAACLEINPSWSRTMPTAIEQAAALEAYRSAQGRVTPRDMEMLRDYYASGLTEDCKKKAFWRPDSRKKFWECFGDVLTHAERWAKETRWDASIRPRLMPRPLPPARPTPRRRRLMLWRPYRRWMPPAT